MQVPRDPPSLFFLDSQKLPGKKPQAILCSFALGNVPDKTANGVDFAAFVEQGKLLNDARMRAIVVKIHLFELHWSAGPEHPEIASTKYGSLIGRENFDVLLADNLVLRKLKSSPVTFIDEQIVPFNIL